MTDGKGERARRIMAAVLTLAEAVREERAEIAASPDTDATALAGHLAGELADAGGRLEDANVARLKWPLDETPRPIEDPKGFLGAVGLVDVLLRALEFARRRGNESAAASEALLREAEAIWPLHRNRREAEAARAEVAKREADRRETARVNAPPPARRVAPARKPAVDPVAQARARRAERAGGMWNIDDDFAIPGAEEDFAIPAEVG